METTQKCTHPHFRSHSRSGCERASPARRPEVDGPRRRRFNIDLGQQLHIITKQIVAYAKQFPKPVIALEGLNGIRNNFKKSKKLNKRFHSLPFRKLQTIIEYKALLKEIEVKYLTRKETKNTSKTYHRRRHFVQLKKRKFRCPKCGLTYNRGLNARINIAHRSMRAMG
ncbi:MAG: IS200/IS605 family element transposase accessory protein TnpB [Candidatus Methanomethyliales bacterium]|nr:IS200/IS605 family element transposase accessory protein TnpB [Candidatus Methanomethylicales archaeon]